MPNLSIKNVPEAVVDKLRVLAASNYRSLQGELMSLICGAVAGVASEAGKGAALHDSGWMSVDEIRAANREKRLAACSKAPRAMDIIRGDRDSR